MNCSVTLLYTRSPRLHVRGFVAFTFTLKLTSLPAAQFGSYVFITNVPLARAVEPPKLDQLKPFRAVLPSPQLSTSSFGRLTAVLQFVIFSGEDADADFAPVPAMAAAATTATARSCLPRPRIRESSHKGESLVHRISRCGLLADRLRERHLDRELIGNDRL